MTEVQYFNGCPKFTLILKSHTQKHRLVEARKELLNVYPYEIKENNIYIVKTDKRKQFDVYISKEEINYKKSIKKYLIISLPLIIIILTLLLLWHTVAVRKMAEATRQKEVEKQNAAAVVLNKEKEEKLEKLRKEYLEKKGAEYEKIYPYIERIYSAMTDKTTIEHISINNNNFTVEVTTKDSVTILSKFEQNKAFTAVKMNRTNIKDGKEIVTYTGEFSKFFRTVDEGKSLDEKIVFYSDEIQSLNKRSEMLRNNQLSQYIKNIRSTLHKNNCHEQYIQLRGKEKNAEVEFYILSASKDILNFINEIQSYDDNLIDIKNLSIHNSENRNRIQTTICFDTGIELKQDIEPFSEYTDKEIELAELDKIFYKAPALKNISPATSANKNNISEKKIQNVSSAKVKKLTYIGLTKSNGKSFVLAKDEDMGSIYKLLLSNAETDGDFCVQTASGFNAKIRGELYEVKK